MASRPTPNQVLKLIATQQLTEAVALCSRQWELDNLSVALLAGQAPWEAALDDICQRQSKKSQTNLAAMLCILKHDPLSAIDTYRQAGCLREALAVASAQLLPLDPVTQQLRSQYAASMAPATSAAAAAPSVVSDVPTKAAAPAPSVAPAATAGGGTVSVGTASDGASIAGNVPTSVYGSSGTFAEGAAANWLLLDNPAAAARALASRALLSNSSSNSVVLHAAARVAALAAGNQIAYGELDTMQLHELCELAVAYSLQAALVPSSGSHTVIIALASDARDSPLLETRLQQSAAGHSGSGPQQQQQRQQPQACLVQDMVPLLQQLACRSQTALAAVVVLKLALLLYALVRRRVSTAKAASTLYHHHHHQQQQQQVPPLPPLQQQEQPSAGSLAEVPNGYPVNCEAASMAAVPHSRPEGTLQAASSVKDSGSSNSSSGGSSSTHTVASGTCSLAQLIGTAKLEAIMQFVWQQVMNERQQQQHAQSQQQPSVAQQSGTDAQQPGSKALSAVAGPETSQSAANVLALQHNISQVCGTACSILEGPLQQAKYHLPPWVHQLCSGIGRVQQYVPQQEQQQQEQLHEGPSHALQNPVVSAFGCCVLAALLCWQQYLRVQATCTGEAVVAGSTRFSAAEQCKVADAVLSHWQKAGHQAVLQLLDAAQQLLLAEQTYLQDTSAMEGSSTQHATAMQYSGQNSALSAGHDRRQQQADGSTGIRLQCVGHGRIRYSTQQLLQLRTEVSLQDGDQQEGMVANLQQQQFKPFLAACHGITSD